MIRRISFFIISCSIISLFSGSFNKEIKASTRNLMCNEPTYNFGEMDDFKTIEHIFNLQNKGNSPIQIVDIDASCRCTEVSICDETILPDKTLALRVKISLKGKTGTVHEKILIQTNDSTTPTLMLSIKGAVLNRVLIEPQTVGFQRVHIDSKSTEKVTISPRHNNVAHFRITNVESSSAFLSTSYDLVDDKSYCIKISTKPPLQLGWSREEVSVFTDNKEFPIIKIPVFMKVVGDLTISPDNIILSNYGNKDFLATRFVHIGPGRIKEFELVGVKPPLQSIKYKIISMNQQGYLIQLSDINPNQELNGKKLKIETSVESMKNIAIPFTVKNASHHLNVPCESTKQ